MKSEVLSGSVAVVAGGAGTGAGLGRGLVLSLARQGASVAILDRDIEAADRLAAELRADGPRAMACLADFSDHASLQSAANQIRDLYGSCNMLCAHVGGGGQGHFDDISIAEWRRALEIMVVGTVATVRAFLPLLRSTPGRPRIVLTSSVAALAPGLLQGPYPAAKAAVTSIGQTLNLELGPEGIGTTVAFPVGMLSPELVGPARSALVNQSVQGDEGIQAAIAKEMMTDPSDLTSGEDAAVSVINALLNESPYVVTHGISASARAVRRHQLLEEALDLTAERSVSKARPRTTAGWGGQIPARRMVNS